MIQIIDVIKEALREPLVFLMEFIGACAFFFALWSIMVIGYGITG